MASPNLSEIVTTTLRNRTGKLADNFTRNNLLLKRLSEKGNIKTVSGGRDIVQEITYIDNASTGWYSGSDVLTISPSDVLTAATYNYAQAYSTVNINGLEEIQNSGEAEVIDLLEARIKNAEGSLMNLVAVGLYSDGTAGGGKQVGGLAIAVPDNPTLGTYGGINRASQVWWRSQKFSGLTDGGAAITSANIQQYMQQLWTRCTRGNDHPDLIPADNNFFNLFWSSLAPIQRINSPETGRAGFTNLAFVTADVILDGGIGGGASGNHMWFLNTKYLFWRPHTKRNFSLLEDRFSTNQDVMIKILAVAGNMTVSNSQLQGVLIS